MHSDVPLLVPRHLSPSSSHPYHPNPLLGHGQEICVARTAPAHGRTWFPPFRQEVPIRRGNDHLPQEISPKLFGRRTLRHFFALSNVQELGIEHLDIPNFMPRIRRYFYHFMPTVRSLALKEPKGSSRQIVHFIGLFKHLEDLKLLCRATDPPEDGQEDDQAPFLPFVPPLRGRLTMTYSVSTDLLRDMIDLFGGIVVRSMNLYDVYGMQPLLDACAETLETLQVYPTDPRGKKVSSGSVCVLARNLQLRTPVGTLIYRGSSHSGLSRSPCGLLITYCRVGFRAISWQMCSRLANPLCSPRSRSFIGTTTSVAHIPHALPSPLHARCCKPKWHQKPRGTIADLECTERCTKSETFGWCCVQMFGTVWGTTRCGC